MASAQINATNSTCNNELRKHALNNMGIFRSKTIVVTARLNNMRNVKQKNNVVTSRLNNMSMFWLGI